MTTTTATTTTTDAPREPGRAQAVFSTEDFQLLKAAVLTHLRANEDAPDSSKYSNLYHRLGRLAR